MNIDVSANHAISRMFRSEEILTRCAAQAPVEGASITRTNRGMTRANQDMVQISSLSQISQSSFAEELTHSISNSDGANTTVPENNDNNKTAYSQTAGNLTSDSGTSEVSSADEGESMSRIVSTPIGVFDLSTKGPNQYTCLTGISEMRAYFMTHQPAEWMENDRARTEFAKIYGEEALVTLDWDGTVPENVDSIWVTKRPIGPDGRPLPNNITSSTLT